MIMERDAVEIRQSHFDLKAIDHHILGFMGLIYYFPQAYFLEMTMANIREQSNN